ncbi:hypothetical protein [Microbacterium sp. Marseille-Q6965]|uniref:hypothetical protein n=1 Tax=Microbacterium sp. Marseille-Q6965 TaxID=2965072 RepID=UPI0021B8010C|nr:hypothetical protein [Microbacterium sp. Marseille-Q6965]
MNGDDPAPHPGVFSAIIDDVNQPSNPARLPQPVAPLEEWLAGSPLIHVTSRDD